MPRVRLIKHEAVPKCGSLEVRFADVRPSEFFYRDDIPGRRLNPDAVDRQTALERATAFARDERDDWSRRSGADKICPAGEDGADIALGMRGGG
jgi:hypothetical protein